MSISDYSHNELIKLLAENLGHESGWREFHRRYHRHVCTVILRECHRIGFRQGLGSLDDLAQEIYHLLLADDGRRLRSFKGRYQHSIFKYLEIIALRLTKNAFRANTAQKRPSSQQRESFDTPAGWLQDGKSTPLADLISYDRWQQKGESVQLGLEIDDCLERILDADNNSERNRQIFIYYFYHDIKVDLIAAFPEIALSSQRVYSTIDQMREKMRRCLEQKNI